MIAVIQRVKHASVAIADRVHAQIKTGLLVFVGIEDADDSHDIEWLTNKIIQLRIFADDAGAMNKDVTEVAGEILVVSQFTLHASTRKGNRPSFIKAAKPSVAVPLYESFLSALSSRLGSSLHSGVFGADMQVTLLNDGPVTIIIDTKNKV